MLCSTATEETEPAVERDTQSLRLDDYTKVTIDYFSAETTEPA